MTRAHVGIDGCRGGWFCIELGRRDAWTFSILPVDGIAGIARSAKAILIDIPIGLLDAEPEERACDREARRLLAPKRGSSVFPAPARATLHARNYPQALAVNRRATGRGLSRQSWAIVAKIRTVDDLLQTNRRLRTVLRECHPELCFRALNGGKPMRHNKKTAAGRRERMAILRRFFPPADELYEEARVSYRRDQLALDDIVDAMAAAVTAKRGAGNYRTLPARPPRDATGLAMEMVYWAPS